MDEKASSVRKFISDKHYLWDNIQDNQAFKGYYQITKGVPSPLYLIVNEDKEVVKLFRHPKDIGKIGVFLQNHFK